MPKNQEFILKLLLKAHHDRPVLVEMKYIDGYVQAKFPGTDNFLELHRFLDESNSAGSKVGPLFFLE